MNKIILTMLAVLLLVSCSDSSTNPIDDYDIPAGMVDANVPGMIIGVHYNNTDYIRSYGVANSETGALFDVDTKIRIGSLTKGLVSTAIWSMIESGTISKSDTIKKWFSTSDVIKADCITLKMLLNHTSCLFDYTNDMNFYTAMITNSAKQWNPSEIMQISKNNGLTGLPGNVFAYANYNYYLLGMILEKLGADSINSVIHHIFNEKNVYLNNTTFYPSAEISGNCTPGYSRFNAMNDLINTKDWNFSWGAGSSNAVSTTSDMLAYGYAMLKNKILRRTTMDSIYKRDYPSTMGYGWDVMNEGTNLWYGLTSSNPGTSTLLVIYPEQDRVLFVAMNYSDFRSAYATKTYKLMLKIQDMFDYNPQEFIDKLKFSPIVPGK